MDAEFDLIEGIKHAIPSPQFLKLMEKINQPCDLMAPKQPPTWLDKQKFQNGVKFYEEWYFSVALSSIMNLLLGLSIPNLW